MDTSRGITWCRGASEGSRRQIQSGEADLQRSLLGPTGSDENDEGDTAAEDAPCVVADEFSSIEK